MNTIKGELEVICKASDFPSTSNTLFMFRLVATIYLLALSSFTEVSSLSVKTPNIISRRNAIFTGIKTVGATAGISTLNPSPSQAAYVKISNEELQKGPPERMELLKKIADNKTEDEVVAAIKNLEKLDPSNGNAATSDKLDGTWELIYSLNAEAFSPLLNLPAFIRPTSLQLIGNDAASVVGSGRIAQVLNFPILPLSYILSSGAVPVESDPSNIEIFPPFRFDLKFGGLRTQVLESGSDADFRALNGRTEEAQAAGRNIYKQRYLETTGQKGDLRISEVISGDPVLVVSNNRVKHAYTFPEL